MTGQPPSLRMRLFLALYAVLWTLGLPIVLWYLRRRGRKDALYAQHVGERFARYQVDLERPVWVHAVSLGELRSAVPLIRGLLERGERVLCTHFTPAGRREAEAVFAPEIAAGRLAAVWVPFEFGWAYRRFFRHFRPKLGLVMEIEIWPRMIFAAQKAGVPLLMCNAQYPSRSMARDAKWVGLGLRHGMMRGFAGALVKSDLQARRFASVGVRNIEVMGELRFDQPVPERLVQAGKGLRGKLAPEREVIVIASAIEGEDAVYLAAMQARRESGAPPLWVYVPRRPERFDEVCETLREAGFNVARRSECLDEAFALKGTFSPAEVLLGDSLGEMYGYLAMADEVIVGGGFSPKGAHNISEALSLKKPVVVGPHVHTIEYPAAEAARAGVLTILPGPEALRAHVASGQRRPTAAEIDAFLSAHSGARDRCLAAVARWLA